MTKKLLTCSLILSMLVAQVALATPSFSDVNETTVYDDSITWMAENGVIQGYPDGTFGPDQCVNRAELLKMLYLTAEKDIDTANTDNNIFSDTSIDEWYFPYVSQAVADGTVEGYEDGTFKPGQCVNRAEAIKMAILEFNDGEIPSYIEENMGFAIDSSQWYAEYLYPAIFNSLVGLEHVTPAGTDISDFHPGESMTRKEVAEMLYRMKTVKDNELDFYTENYTPNNIGTFVYHNSEYKFSLDFPYAWETAGFITSNRSIDWGDIGTNDSIDFGLTDQYSLFNISIVTHSQWQQMQSIEGPKPEYLAENDEYVFCLSHAQDAANNSIVERMEEIPEIIETFEFIDQITFDECGSISNYNDEVWLEDFVASWDTYLLTLPIETGSLPSHDALTDEFGDYCLAEDNSIFIFIPYYLEDGDARVFQYDIAMDSVAIAEVNGDYQPQEFGARTDDYIPLIGINDYYGCEYITGNYYYMDNFVDTSVATTCSN